MDSYIQETATHGSAWLCTHDCKHEATQGMGVAHASPQNFQIFFNNGPCCLGVQVQGKKMEILHHFPSRNLVKGKFFKSPGDTLSPYTSKTPTLMCHPNWLVWLGACRVPQHSTVKNHSIITVQSWLAFYFDSPIYTTTVADVDFMVSCCHIYGVWLCQPGVTLFMTL